MSVMPQRGQSEWALVEGTRTMRAGLVPVLCQPARSDGPAVNVVMAFHSALPPHGGLAEHVVRVDFLWAVEVRFSAFFSPPLYRDDRERRYFAMHVTDISPMKDRFVETFRDPEWEYSFPGQGPGEVIRHFSIGFDNLGRYDLLAIDARVQTFHHPGLDTSADILRAALEHGGPP